MFFSFLLKLSSRDKAGTFLFGLQIRNNVKIYADGLSSKRGKHKVFFHVTLTDKNFLKNTLAVFLLYCYILYRYSTSSSHRIVCPYVKFQNSSQMFSLSKSWLNYPSRKEHNGIAKEFFFPPTTKERLLTKFKSRKKITIRTFHGDKTTHWKYKPPMTNNLNQTLPCFSLMAKPNRSETKLTKTRTRTIWFYNSSSSTCLIWFW